MTIRRMGRGRAAVLACLLAFAPLVHGELEAGAAKRSIVPPFPTLMGGFGDRMQTFTGVHDEIFVRALYLDDGSTSLIIIGSGLMSVDGELAGLVRETVNEDTGVPEENILVSCVHNHSAPSYYQHKTKEEQRPLRDFLARRFSEAAIEAYKNRVPAKAGYRNGEIRGATRNRQQSNETVVDTQVGVLRVEEREGRKIIATLFNFTGHPVIVGSENLLLSGEFPGAASRTVEQVLGGVALCTQGACGDVTVHRSGDPFLEVERLGRLIAGEVIKTAESIRPVAELRLASAYQEIPLARKALLPVNESRAKLDTAEKAQEAAKAAGADRAVERQHENRVRLLRALHRQSEQLAAGSLPLQDTYTGSVHVLQIGDLVIAGVPGELFVEYALEMRQRVLQTTGKSFILSGYSNGHIGYIVTPRAMETGGYEASVARVGKRAGRILTEAAMALVSEIVR